MPNFNPIFDTLVVSFDWDGVQYFNRITFYGFNGHKAHSPKLIFEFRKEKKITGGQIWRIWWLSDDSRFVVSQKMNSLPTNPVDYLEGIHVEPHHGNRRE